MLYGYCPKKLQKKWLESLECNKKASTFASAFDKESRWNSQWMRWLKEWGKQTSSTSRLTWWSIGTSMKVNVEKTKIDYGPARDIKRNFLQWRVWSWLRMNASYRLNTCKSRGSMKFACKLWWRPAHGWVTRIQPADNSGIAFRKKD